MARYEVSMIKHPTEPNMRSVWDWNALHTVRDAADEIMWYPKDIIHGVVRGMNEWDRKHPER